MGNQCKMKFFSVLLLVLIENVFSEEIKVPEWENLECEVGHKYLFVNAPNTWDNAILECQANGGWLVDINSQSEQNCLMRYGKSQGFNHWYWTDGNDRQSKGTFVHASTDTEVTWFGPKWTCCLGENPCYHGGDAMMLGIVTEKKKKKKRLKNMPMEPG